MGGGDIRHEEDHSGQRNAAHFVPVEFRGSGVEYFGIWIVNLLLSFITLGIYGAWAKVRTKRYFLGHTLVHGHSFRYLAHPGQILIGRGMIVLLWALTLLATSYGGVVVSFLWLAGIVLAIPYFICMGLRFNRRMTAYRNVRFDFTGTYAQAFLVFILYPLLSCFTLFLALPWALKKFDEFIYSNTKYGDKPFMCELETGKYYYAGFMVLISLVVLSLLVFGLGITIHESVPPGDQLATYYPTLLGVVAYMALFAFSGSIYTAITKNYLASRLRINGLAQFHSSIKVLSLIGLRLSNLALLLATFGLAFPLTKIRKARFYANATSVHIDDTIDNVIAQMPEEVTAIGDEAATAFKWEIGLA